MRIDLHTHSVTSDGTDTPVQLVRAAERAGLDLIALTDHDTMAGVPEATAEGDRIGVRVLPGVELSANHLGVEVHLLGYDPDPAHPGLQAEMLALRSARDARLPAMLARLAALGIAVDESAVRARADQHNVSVGRPHVADMLVELGHVANRDEAFARYLDSGGPAYVPRYTVALEKAIGMLHAAGGAAVLAHPGIRGAPQVLGEQEITRLVTEHGLDGIEVDHPMHDAATSHRLRRIAEPLGVVCTGSSDYHGLGKIGHDLGSVTTPESAWQQLRERIQRHDGTVA